MAEFIGPKAEYYLKSFEKNRGNWPAFLFGPAWLLYRKMYRESVVMMLVLATCIYVAVQIELAMGRYSDLSLGVIAAESILLPLLYLLGANPLYKRFCKQRINRLRIEGKQDLRAAGGVISKWLATFGYIVIYVLAIMLSVVTFVAFNWETLLSLDEKLSSTSPSVANNQSPGTAFATDRVAQSTTIKPILVTFFAGESSLSTAVKNDLSKITNDLNRSHNIYKVMFTCHKEKTVIKKFPKNYAKRELQIS